MLLRDFITTIKGGIDTIDLYSKDMKYISTYYLTVPSNKEEVLKRYGNERVASISLIAYAQDDIIIDIGLG